MKPETPKGYGETPKGSQGTPEEIKRGEGMMNVKEKNLSVRREEITKRFKEAGIVGEIKKLGKDEIFGTINGQYIKVSFSKETEDASVKTFYGSVTEPGGDYHRLTANDAAKVWEKFTGERVTLGPVEEKTGGFIDDITEKDLNAARKMVTEDAIKQQSAKALKSIGL